MPTGATRRLVPEYVCKSNEVEWIIQKTISRMLKIENWENENEDVKKPFGGVQIRSERREIREREIRWFLKSEIKSQSCYFTVELQWFVHWMSKQLLLQDGAEFCDSSSLLAAPNR